MADETIELTEVQEVLDGLSSPSDEEFVQAVRGYSDGAVASAAAKLAMAGGGGGGGAGPDFVTPVTIQTDDVPLTVSNGNDDVVFDIQSDGSIDNFGDGSTFSPTFYGEFMNLNPQTAGGDLPALSIQSDADNNDPLVCSRGATALLRVTGAGSLVFRVLGGQNMTIDGLPTVDPASVGAIWNDAGILKVSAG